MQAETPVNPNFFGPFKIPDGRDAFYSHTLPYTRKDGTETNLFCWKTCCVDCAADLFFRSPAGQMPFALEPARVQKHLASCHPRKHCAACLKALRARATHLKDARARALEVRKALAPTRAAAAATAEKASRRAQAKAARQAAVGDPSRLQRGNAVLTDLDVIELRVLWVATGWMMGRPEKVLALLARQHGVSFWSMRQIIYGTHRPLNQGPIAAYQAQRLLEAGRFKREHEPQPPRRKRLPDVLEFLSTGTIVPPGFDLSAEPYVPPADYVPFKEGAARLAARRAAAPGRRARSPRG
ncbi:MAG: hypothetical protein ACLGQW_08750 [Acidobacteriota bacterium]